MTIWLTKTLKRSNDYKCHIYGYSMKERVRKYYLVRFKAKKSLKTPVRYRYIEMVCKYVSVAILVNLSRFFLTIHRSGCLISLKSSDHGLQK